MMREESTLEARDVHAGYRQEDVIEGLSIKIAPGDFIGIVGPNGSGKTSFLRSLSRALKPRKGVVLLSGDDVYRTPARAVARVLAVVPQDPTMSFDFCALEIVLMGRNPHLGRLQAAGQRDLEIARLAMERSNVWHLADRTLSELSGGERQRVVIAQALTQSPKLLLLDEPTQHLDIQHQLALLELLSEMTEEGLSCVMVMHDINLAAQYCREIVMIKGGREFARGTPVDVITAANIMDIFRVDSIVTKHPVTGKPSITFLPGVQAHEDVGIRVHLICGGASGAPLMRELLERGFYVTAGVLNAGDSDAEVGEALEIRMVTEAPFSRISDRAHAANVELIRAADAVVVTEVQVGSGNLKNLEAALEALESGKKVVLLSPHTIDERDFTGGKATGLYGELISRGAVEVTEEEAVFSLIKSDLAGDENGRSDKARR